MTPRPSLFGHAPSELSQDAFLAWLIEWANPGCKALDRHLHATGTHLLRTLFAAAEEPARDLGEIRTVEVRRQYLHIDLFLVVNDRRALILEDKVHAGQHGKQLQEYREAIEKEGHLYPDGIHAVYLKTGSQTDPKTVKDEGFGYMSREDLLALLRAALDIGASNDILLDFTAHLRRMDEEFAAWRTLPPGSWTYGHRLWETVFHELRRRVPRSGWRWVPNNEGGQYVFWIGGIQVEPDVWVYVQADSRTRLHLRLSTKATTTPERRALRNRWSAALCSHSSAGVHVTRPRPFAIGSTMAVADYVGTWMHGSAEGGGDLDAIAATLLAVDTWLKALPLDPKFAETA